MYYATSDRNYLITHELSLKHIMGEGKGSGHNSTDRGPWLTLGGQSQSEPTATGRPQGMDDWWTGNTFLLGSSSLAN
jgi:hypothetical protein